MQFKSITTLPVLNVTPLATVYVKNTRVTIEVDDDQEKRFGLVFEPYQAVRSITADSFTLPEGLELRQNIVEVIDSPWLAQLKASLRSVDEMATFLDKSRDFIIPVQDDFIEVIAWEYEKIDLPNPDLIRQ